MGRYSADNCPERAEHSKEVGDPKPIVIGGVIVLFRHPIVDGVIGYDGRDPPQVMHPRLHGEYYTMKLGLPARI